MGGISLITIYDRKFRHNRPEEGLPKMITYISPINSLWVGFLMHLRPFSVKKIDFFPISPIFEIFWPIFFDDLLNIGLSLPHETLDSPRVPHCRFILKTLKKLGKIGFPMPTLKNGFQILNLHPKKHVFKKIPFFWMNFCLSNT